MPQPTPAADRLALFALRPLVGPSAVTAAFAWAAASGAPPDALGVARRALEAGERLVGGEWVGPSTPPSGPAPQPSVATAEPGGPLDASLASERPSSRPDVEEPVTVPLRASKRHRSVAPSGATSPTPPPPADPYVHLTASLPRSLLRAIDQRAAALGVPRAAYLRGLVRADLGAAGLEVPEEPPAAPRGMHAARGRGRVRGLVNTRSKNILTTLRGRGTYNP